MAGAAGGRPRDKQIDTAILEATRQLLATISYGELSMERVAASAQVGKKTLYRRWSSKAALVADAVLDAYGRGGSFDVPDTGDVVSDLRAWLIEHAEFTAEPVNAALIRALIAAAAAQAGDNIALYQQLSAPQHDGLLTRLRAAVAAGSIRADADLDAIATALIGSLLLQMLNGPAQHQERPARFDGLIDALLHGSLATIGDAAATASR